MKKILSILLVMMMFSFRVIAEESKSNTTSQGIKLEIAQYTETPVQHRASMHLNLEAYYGAGNNTVEILYDGDASGEVFIYLNENLIGYDSKINTSIQLPTIHGLYTIVIEGENWIAKGSIQL